MVTHNQVFVPACCNNDCDWEVGGCDCLLSVIYDVVLVVVTKCYVVTSDGCPKLAIDTIIVSAMDPSAACVDGV